jgi:hypothetical protein
MALGIALVEGHVTILAKRFIFGFSGKASHIVIFALVCCRQNAAKTVKITTK